MGLGGDRYATDWLGVGGDVTDTIAEDKDIIHSDEKLCTIISKRVFVAAPSQFTTSMFLISDS